MTINFILSAMVGGGMLWYTFGGIASISGVDRIFGLDYCDTMVH